MRRPAVIAGAFVLAATWSARAQEGAPPPFTHAQAEHGGELYAERCASCHGADLNNGEFGPSLKGPRFTRKWGGKSAAELFGYLGASMPPGQAGVLTPNDYADLMAFLLEAGGAHAGDKPLPAETQALSGLKIPG